MKSNAMEIFPLDCDNNCAIYSEIMTWEWLYKQKKRSVLGEQTKNNLNLNQSPD